VSNEKAAKHAETAAYKAKQARSQSSTDDAIKVLAEAVESIAKAIGELASNSSSGPLL
jgi:hypothetical protein